MRITLAASLGALLALGACTSTGNIERGVVGGAAAGAAIGAVVGNNSGDGDAGDGAEKGAAIGAVVGGAYGLGRDQSQRRQQQYGYGQPPQRYYDQRAGRYYTIDPATGRTYWENGAPRTW